MTERELEYRRKRAGLSIVDLATTTGINYGRIWRGLRGTRLSADELRQIEGVVEAMERALHLVAV